MAFNNFIPTVFAEELQRELSRMHVFADGTNRQYEGTIKGQGDSVKILGVGKPTVTLTTDRNFTFDPPETLEDSSIIMPIRQIAKFNYMVEDIDKALSKPRGIMSVLAQEVTEGVADLQDQYVANLAKSDDAVLDASSPYQITTSNVLDKIDAAVELLYKNDVKPNAELEAIVPPEVYFMLKKAYVNLDTDNSEMLKNGKVGRYGGVTIKMSNNVAKNSAGGHLIQLRTKRAIAFVNAISKTKAYEPESKLGDAVKGISLFDAKIVRPKEMIVMNVKYTA